MSIPRTTISSKVPLIVYMTLFLGRLSAAVQIISAIVERINLPLIDSTRGVLPVWIIDRNV